MCRRPEFLFALLAVTTFSVAATPWSGSDVARASAADAEVLKVSGLASGPATGPNPGMSSSLDTQLAEQWTRFAAARKALVEKIGCREGQLPLSRDVWEKMVGSSAWTPKLLAELRSRHLSLIEASRLTFVRESAISLNKLRGDAQKTARFCAAFPKGAMLHVHPSGTVSVASALSILRASDPVIARDKILRAVSRPEARFNACELGLLKTLPKEKRFSKLTHNSQLLLAELAVLPRKAAQGFVEFQSKFSYIEALGESSDFDPLPLLMKDFLRRAKGNRVSYVELTRSCPATADALSRADLESRTYARENGVGIGVNCSFNRTAETAHVAAKARAFFAVLLANQKAGIETQSVRGIDLLGDEDGADNPTLDVSALGSQAVYACYLEKRAQGLELKATMHAGELGEPRNVRDALIMGVNRLGHAVKLADDPVALEYARINKIPVEVNLVSNLRLGAVQRLSEHPFLSYLRLGIPVSLSTDDEGILETDIDNECRQAIAHTDITYAELKLMSLNSISSSFATEEEKAKRLEQLETDLRLFETGWAAGKLAAPGKPRVASEAANLRHNPCF